MAVGVLLGAGLGIGLLVKSSEAQPSRAQTFTSGESTTVHFDAGETKVVFSRAASSRHRVHCTASSDTTGGVEVAQFRDSLTLDEWEAVITVRGTDSGDYEIGCTGYSSDVFGVGGDLSAATFIGSVFGILAGAVLTVLGLVTLILTAVLRRRRTTGMP